MGPTVEITLYMCWKYSVYQWCAQQMAIITAIHRVILKINNVDMNIILHAFLCICLNVKLLCPRRGMCLDLGNSTK